MNFSQLTDCAFYRDLIFVCDQNYSRVLVLDSDGKLLRSDWLANRPHRASQLMA